MRDRIDLGPTPAEEGCAQLGTARYEEKARLECNTYIEQIKRVCGPPPQGCRLFIKSNAHDYGTYYEVNLDYDSNVEETVKYMLKVENEGPLEWDRESLQALGLHKRLKELDDESGMNDRDP